MKKLLFFDIDGTLLDESNQEVPKSTMTALQKAQENGHLVFINTGRSFTAVPNIIKNMNIDGYVCGCGGYLSYHGEVLQDTTLDIALCQQLVQKLNECKLSAVLESTNCIYFDTNNINERVEGFRQSLKTEDTICASWDQENLQFDKLTVFLNEDSQFEPFYETFKDQLHFIQRDETFYEIIPTHISKATGIAYFLDYFNLPFDCAYAFGDSANDLAMLEYVKHSIAMGVSHPDVLKTCEYVTTNLEDDGIQHALEHYGII